MEEEANAAAQGGESVIEVGSLNVGGPNVSFSVTPEAISAVLEWLINKAPEEALLIQKYAPYAAVLPSPFNLIASPLVLEAARDLPLLLPIAKELQQLFAALSAQRSAQQAAQ